MYIVWRIVEARHSAWAGLVLAGLLLGISCSGPSPDTPPRTEEAPNRVYHVQLDMMKEKEAADRRLAEALAWWNEHDSVPTPASIERDDRTTERPIVIVWKAPYYRVRLGPYVDRSRAEDALSVARASFPDAFVAPQRFHSAQ